MSAPSPEASAQPDFTDKVVLVTGASRGIGRACALAFARAGAQVVATARTQGALEELDDEIAGATGRAATLVPMNLADGDAVDRLGGAIYERWGRLDVLFSCAGELGLVTPVAQLDVKVWDRTVAVNLTANYRLIRSMDPLLRAAPAGRAVFVTSGIASRPRAFFGPYAATKAGLEALVRTYAEETEHTAVRCALLSPGPVATRMHATAFPGADPAEMTQPEDVAPLALELARADREPPAEPVRFTKA